MYPVHFYKNSKGIEPVYEFLKELTTSKNARDRKRANKINEYIQMLSVMGKSAGEPYIKHIQGELWELRPARDRIFFVAWIDNGFVLLHQFLKKTQQTPKSEIDKAMREIADLKKRGLPNG